VADIDEESSGGRISLDVPRWSALGDTVFLRPLLPLAFDHVHGMRVNTIFALDGTASSDLAIIYFTTGARAKLEPVSPEELSRTIPLTPGVTTPVGFPVQEVNDTQTWFNLASTTFLDAAGGAIDSVVTPVSITIPRKGAATLSLPVTLPEEIARSAPQGALQLRLAWYGTDESALPFTFTATVPVQVSTAIATALVVQSALLEFPQQGAAFGAGDTVRASAMVTGIGTGRFLGAFFLDGEMIATEEGYMEAGRPVRVEMRGPLPTRRLGEHRIQFQVTSPQAVAARPVTFSCIPPVNGIRPRELAATPEAPAAPPRLTSSVSFLAAGKSQHREEDGSALVWGFGNARYDLGKGVALEASGSMRFRADDAANGSARPEQLRVRLSNARGSLEYSDAVPEMASGVPLFMSPVLRRAAQGRATLPGGGDVQGYAAVESRPAGAGGAVDQIRSDLYAGRIARAFADSTLQVTAYGGYAHEDPTPGGAETVTRRSSTYGALGRARLGRGWTLLADAGSVHHLEVEGIEPANTRSAWRTELVGAVAGVKSKVTAFRYQPDLRTALNPYAISDRRGGSVDLARSFMNRYDVFAGFRTEQPDAQEGLIPTVRVDRLNFGTSFVLNQESRVTPAYVVIKHRGANTAYEERRIVTEFTQSERRGGRTSVRLDAADYRDDKAANARRRVYSGSLVSTLSHFERSNTTLSLGYEEDVWSDLDKTNRTITGAFETRYEAIPGRLLITPWVAGASQDYQVLGTKQNRLGGRLQIALLRLAGLGENALALTGRVDHVEIKSPVSDTSTEGSVELSWGQRFDW
jgi:hypothetical protein